MLLLPSRGVWIRSSLTGVRSLLIGVMPLLCHEDATDTLVNRFKLCEIGRRNLDGVAGYREDYNVFPGVKFILVFDHLWPLPIVLDAGALKRELFHLYRYWTTSLCFNHCNIIFRLKMTAQKMIEHIFGHTMVNA